MATCFPFLTDLASAAPIVQNAALTEKAEYLLKASEENISWAQHLMQINTGFITVIAFAFISIVLYIIKQFKDLHKERMLNEEKIKQINDLALEIKKVSDEIEKVKKDMIDSTLANRETRTTDDDIAKFIKEALHQQPTIEWVNFFKNLMWKENTRLEQIKPAAEDIELQKTIQTAYQNMFGTNDLDNKRVIEWAYQLKANGIPLQTLLTKEKESKVYLQQLYKKWFQARNPRYYSQKETDIT